VGVFVRGAQLAQESKAKTSGNGKPSGKPLLCAGSMHRHGYLVHASSNLYPDRDPSPNVRQGSSVNGWPIALLVFAAYRYAKPAPGPENVKP